MINVWKPQKRNAATKLTAREINELFQNDGDDLNVCKKITEEIMRFSDAPEYRTETYYLILSCVIYLCRFTYKKHKSISCLYYLVDSVDIYSDEKIQVLDQLFIAIASIEPNACVAYYKLAREMSKERFGTVCITAKAVLLECLQGELDLKIRNLEFYGPLKEALKEHQEEQGDPKAENALKKPEDRSEDNPNAKDSNSCRPADPIAIRKFLDEDIVGQEEAKRMLSVCLANHMKASQMEIDIPRGTTLIIGPTGSGKTFLAKKLSEYSGLPIASIDASQLTGSGWHGLDIEAPLRTIFQSGHPHAKYGILVMDEFDKFLEKGNSRYDTFGDDATAAVLGVLDGFPVTESNWRNEKEGMEYPTKNLLIILTGSFEKMKKSERSKKAIGFSAKVGMPQDRDIRQRLMDYGVIPEIVGRITTIVHTTPLDEDEVVSAVIDKENSFCAQYRRLLESYGKVLNVDRQYVKNIISANLAGGLGVRGAKSALESRLRDLLYRSFQDSTKTVCLCEKEEPG